MPRSFRFEPPTPRPGSLTRPRLLRALLGRWEHKVTTVVGGPGLGKTTLLAQAVAENRLAPRGEDIWIGLNPQDEDADVLSRDVLAAVLASAAAAATHNRAVAAAATGPPSGQAGDHPAAAPTTGGVTTDGASDSTERTDTIGSGTADATAMTATVVTAGAVTTAPAAMVTAATTPATQRSRHGAEHPPRSSQGPAPPAAYADAHADADTDGHGGVPGRPTRPDGERAGPGHGSPPTRPGTAGRGRSPGEGAGSQRDTTVAGGPPEVHPDAEGEAVDPAVVADAVWQLAPTAVCLVLDDAHALSRGSSGASWLAGLVEALPDNGHLAVAGRWAPPIPLARLATHGDVLRLVEEDLRFSGSELAGFAAQRGIAPDRLSLTGGWPAMAELAATVSGDLTGDYLWEEVLEPLGPERRRVLAVLTDLGGADDHLAEAALGAPVDLASTLDGVPLMAQGADGWRVPHPLWRTVAALALSDDERRETRRRAIGHLVEHHRYDEAITLAGEAGLDEEIPTILRAACIGPLRPPARRLDRWLADLPEEGRGSAGAALAAGLRAALATPGDAVEPLRSAIELCRSAGDPEGELSALADLGRVAWWRSDLTLLAEIYPRVLELEAEGHREARAIAGLGRAIIADVEGDDDLVLELLDAIEPGVLDPGWQSMADWLRASTLVGRGQSDEAGAILDAISDGHDPAFHLTIEGARLAVRWSQGHVDEVVAALVPLVDDMRAAGVTQNVTVSLGHATYTCGAVGDAVRGRMLLDQARQAARDAGAGFEARLAIAEASVLLAEGDEASATAVLEAALADNRLDGGDRRLWRNALALTYVLVPSTRSHWDAAPLQGYLALARRLAAAVVGLRKASAGTTGADDLRRALGDVDLTNPETVRVALHHRFAIDLVLGLEAAGRPEAGTLLEALGPAGREAVRDVAAGRSQQARAARSLLAAVPAPPRQATEINVLGPLEVVRDGEVVVENELRRVRVRALLAYLVGHRNTTRAAITAALWPDLDEAAAANNLRVTITYLLRLIEPWRSAREPSYFVRVDGPHIALITGDRLRIDLDRFDDHVAEAARADADGVPSLALEHNLAATELYRGELHDGVADAEWLGLERERAKARFVAAASRAGQLLAARGDNDEAERVASRAVAVDRWSEAAHDVLVSVALARGDRSAARRALDRALAALAELGMEPSDETGRLRRRLRNP